MRKIFSSSSCFSRLIVKQRLYSGHCIEKSNRNSILLISQDKAGNTKIKYMFAGTADVEQQKKLIVPFKGYLSVRNSQNMDLLFQASPKSLNILINKNSNVQQAKQLIKQKLDAKQVNFLCNEIKQIAGLTPIQALLDRNFFIILDQNYSVKIQGQHLRPAQINQNIQNFQNLELPLVARNDIFNYFSRINTWVQSKYGAGFQNSSIKIPKAQAKKILIQSLLDPLESTNRMLKKQQQFQQLYWQVQKLLDKKSQAAVECSKTVRNRMSLGVILILANVGFIWGGTYIVYSWDIIEPIAYFISSMAGIILCTRFFKIKRPFSLMNYKKYMISKHMPLAMQKVGLDINQLNRKQIMLAQLQAEIKDYYLKRL